MIEENRELFVIRHGETDLNLQGIVQGRRVNPPLNATGQKQARQFFDFYKDEGFDIIYTSTLRRAQESVSGFIEKQIPWEQHAELDEISWGEFEGKHASAEFKALYRKLIEEWNSGDLTARSLHGESPLDVQQRQLSFINYLEQQTYKKALICMHGRAMRIFLPTLMNLSLSTMDEFPHHNLTLYKLNFHDGRWNITLFNNMDHLNANEKD